MEIKATLPKPYTEQQREQFVLTQNHINHYDIKETEVALEAWGNTEAENFEIAKANKYTENDAKANRHLVKEFTVTVGENETPCVFIYNSKTESNLNSAALLILSGQAETKKWTDEQGITVYLRREDIIKVGRVFEVFADAVWVRWGDYKADIDAATTQAELDAIVIDYTDINVSEGEQ